MNGRRFIRIALTIVVLAGILARGLGLRFGVRHRHDGGDAAHSHGAVSHSHGGSRFHTHSHSHAQGHSHSHSHFGEHTHPHTKSRSDSDASTDNLAESHVHVTIFGFELTLPDFGFSEPAPLVDSQRSTENAVCEGQVVELPSPFALSNALQFWMDQTAISVGLLDVSDAAGPREFVCSSPSRNLGRDASRPLLPPPRTGSVIQLC